jgi:uncharacterized protein with FMN-binding domain
MAGKKLSNTLLTLSSAAILAVYAAGFERTAPAAARFEAQTMQRLTTMPLPSSPLGQPGLLAGPGTYRPPVASPKDAATPVVQPAAPVPVGLPNSIMEPQTQGEVRIEAAPPVPQPPAPESSVAASVNETVAAAPVLETTPAPAPIEAPAEVPVMVAALAPESAPIPEAPAPAAAAAPAPTPGVSAPVNEPVAAAVKHSEPEAKTPKAPKPPKPPKAVKSDAKQAPQPAIQPAPQPAPAAAPQPAPPAAPTLQDGTYYGWGTSRHGDIQAEVVIQNGRIASATIAQCETRYPCSIIEKAPPQVAQRQSAAVDVIAGATESTYAFYYAVLDALSKAR